MNKDGVSVGLADSIMVAVRVEITLVSTVFVLGKLMVRDVGVSVALVMGEAVTIGVAVGPARKLIILSELIKAMMMAEMAPISATRTVESIPFLLP
jgi:hypothetical protein